MKSLGFVVAFATLAYAGAKKPPKPAAIEDPCVDGDACKRHALDAFRDALAAQRAGTASHPLRVSYFGDSLTADDHITGDLRAKLQPSVRTERAQNGYFFVYLEFPAGQFL